MTDQIEHLLQKIETLQSRLNEAEEALRAIGTGEVDAVVVYSDQGERIYTLQGAEHAYRVMVESIHEGAANIKVDGTVLYCNKHLAEMLEMPLEAVLGTSFSKFLLANEQAVFAELIRRGIKSYGRAEFNLIRYQRPTIPVLITASTAEVDGMPGLCLVITDLTEQKQALARERELQMCLMEQREEERVRIARNLHDGPLQVIYFVSCMIQAMLLRHRADEDELVEIRSAMRDLSSDLRTVCNDLRPPTSIRFGLAKAIKYHSEDTQLKYPDLTIHLELAEDGETLANEIRTALFRIYQECMNNVIHHANATVVEVRLLFDQSSVLMEVQDNGKGFQPPQDWGDLARQGHLGLVGMRERAKAVGGTIRVLSGDCNGTTMQVDVPFENSSFPAVQNESLAAR